MENQCGGALWLTVVQSLFQRIEHKVCSHKTVLPSAHYSVGIDIYHEDYVLTALPGREVCEV